MKFRLAAPVLLKVRIQSSTVDVIEPADDRQVNILTILEQKSRSQFFGKKSSLIATFCQHQ